jgi:hypothetical protein
MTFYVVGPKIPGKKRPISGFREIRIELTPGLNSPNEPEKTIGNHAVSKR